MSDKHDGSAVIVVMDRDDCDKPIGEITYVFGKRDTVEFERPSDEAANAQI